MSVRQYIGARYVIKVYENSLDPSSAEWEQGTFEPLTMVTWQNSSYLSKKQVPGSVGNPADNPDYWVCTGYYNGQIAALQDAIDNINNVVIPAIEDQIREVSSLSDRKVFIIMDSYGTRKTSDNKYVDQAIEDITGASCHLEAASGGGVVNGLFLGLVNNYAGADIDEFDTALIIGGANDQPQSYSDIVSGMETLIDAIHAKFTNVKNVVVMCPGLTFSGPCETRETVWKAYQEGAQYRNAVYCDNSQYILRNTKMLASDRCHPSNRGVDKLVEFGIDALKKGYCDVHYEIITNFTNADGVTPNKNYQMVRNNGLVTISPSGGLPQLYYGATVTGIAGGRITFGTFDDSLIDNPITDGYEAGCIGTYIGGDNVDYTATCEVLIQNNAFKGFVVMTSGTQTSGTKLRLIASGLTFNN